MFLAKKVVTQLNCLFFCLPTILEWSLCCYISFFPSRCLDQSSPILCLPLAPSETSHFGIPPFLIRIFHYHNRTCGRLKIVPCDSKEKYVLHVVLYADLQIQNRFDDDVTGYSNYRNKTKRFFIPVFS